MADEGGEKKEAETKRTVHTYPLIRVSLACLQNLMMVLDHMFHSLCLFRGWSLFTAGGGGSGKGGGT